MDIYLAHGASGSAASMRAHVDGLAERGFAAHAVSLPVGRAEAAIPRYRAQVADLPPAVIGGHSFGGRVASLLAAEEQPRALVLLSYPLHRPGQPHARRTEHWPEIGCPVLVVAGESDPFARLAELRDAVRLLRHVELHTYAGIGHGLTPVLPDALDRIASFCRALA